MARQDLEKHGVFVGFPDEHAHFQQLFGMNIELAITNNAYDMVQNTKFGRLMGRKSGLRQLYCRGPEKDINFRVQRYTFWIDSGALFGGQT
jgi:hypothetical protein